MDYFTKKGMEKLLEDEEVVRRLTEFMAMDGAAYFEEVRSHLSPEELEEYLDENLSEKVGIHPVYPSRKRAACQMTNRPSSSSSSK
ncbi:hypothetical protein QMP26_11965 [Enterocloster clostridioformis]|uniref:hypothetical protein n=1 Tax=Enterocloster clostridioformis TaxID=1531 RepID=UPI00267673CB|nr:hypothetical protein [Enterocloster clostridioformis]